MSEAKKNKILKSEECLKKSFLVLRCLTRGRRAAVYWRNYEGEPVRYTVLNYGQSFYINTFESHPWEFADADTSDILVANGQKIYMPKAWNGENYRTELNISIPVYSLRERCIQKVRQTYKNHTIPQDELPTTLREELEQNYDMKFSVYCPPGEVANGDIEGPESDESDSDEDNQNNNQNP